MTDERRPAETFEHVIRVGWGDCDPARIVFTGRIPSFALDAIDAFWERATGVGGWFENELDHGVGMPFVHMSLDFRQPIGPRHRLVCRVFPVALGKTSVTLRVEGRQDGALCFEGRFVEVFVDPATFSKRPPPERIVEALAPYLVEMPA
ncbi:MAG: acyl-CoA thioesterase [Hyphomicrobiales bacterium]|nr:acyl-CoA thioesterase [Hyphomicrobiales bacterium]